VGVGHGYLVSERPHKIKRNTCAEFMVKILFVVKIISSLFRECLSVNLKEVKKIADNLIIRACSFKLA